MAFNASGGRLRSAGSATERRIANGTRCFNAYWPAIRLSRSTAAASVARRSCALAAAVTTGASETATRSTTTRAAAPRRRWASDAVTVSSVLTAPSFETISEPRMRSPGRSRGSRPPHRPQLTTSDGRRPADSASRARRVGASPQSVVSPGPLRIAASRFSPQTIRTFADDGKGRGRRLAERLASQQGSGPLAQCLDQGFRAAAAGEDRGEFVAPGGEIADRAIEIDVDDAAAANEIVDLNSPAARLEELGPDNLAAARGGARLRVEDKALTGIIRHLVSVIGDEEAGEGVANRSLLGARELAPGRPRRQSRHGPNVEGGSDGWRETTVAFADAE